MKVYKFRITGLRPLLMHNAAGMLAPKPTGVSVKTIPTPEDEAEAGAYRLKDSRQLYLPSMAFRSAIVGPGGGASGRKIGKNSAAQRFSGGVFMVEDRCPLFHPKTKAPLTEYEVDVRRAVVQKAGIARARPLVREWACDLSLEIDESFITPDVVLELLNMSGRVAGVGDYRPQKKGPFGLFQAELVGAR